jgi:hypothetical protein
MWRKAKREVYSSCVVFEGFEGFDRNHMREAVV